MKKAQIYVIGIILVAVILAGFQTHTFAALDIAQTWTAIQTHTVKIVIGTSGVDNSGDPMVIVSRNVDDGTAGNGHAFSDSSTVTRSGGIGYNSFDAVATYSGSNNFDHYVGLQNNFRFNGSGTMNSFWGAYSAPVFNSGTITTAKGYEAHEYGGAGAVGTYYGFFSDGLAKAGTNWAFYANGTTPSYFGGTLNPASGIVGVSTNSSASSGIVGEFVSTKQATPQSLSNGVILSLGSVSLTAGDWDIVANGVFTGTSTNVTNQVVAISSSNSSYVPNDGSFENIAILNVPNGATGLGNENLITPRFRVSISGTTNYFLLTSASFSTGTQLAAGTIRARRVR